SGDTRIRMVGEALVLSGTPPGFVTDGTGVSFTHVASVDPPAGRQATDFASFGAYLAVSYMAQGEAIAGGVDVLDFSDPARPRIVWSWTSDEYEYGRILRVDDKTAYLFG